MRLLFHFRQQTTYALLELAVLGGVDERVDDAVAEHEYGDQVIVPSGEVDRVGAVADDNQQLVR